MLSEKIERLRKEERKKDMQEGRKVREAEEVKKNHWEV